MILMVVGGNKDERQKLTKLIGGSIPNFVVRRSIYQPIKEVVSDNDAVNKLTLIGKDLPYIGDTTDFVDHSNSELLSKIKAVKDTFDTCFSKDFMFNHFNAGLISSQYFNRPADSLQNKPIFIIDDIEKKDDLSFMYDNLKRLCSDTKHVIGKNLFSSIRKLMEKGDIETHEAERVKNYDSEIKYYKENYKKDEVEPEILTIVIKNEDNSISQVYPGATINTMEDLPSYNNIIEIKSSDLNTNLKSLGLIIYNIFYKDIVKKELS